MPPRRTPPFLSLLACLGGLAFAPASNAERAHYALDPVHTRVAFQVGHAGLSRPVGSFSGTQGSLDFDPADWASARLEATIPIATLDLGDADWQGKILDRTFFDATRFPVARFVSTRVEGTGPDTANVTGDLTLHGITAPVTLSVRMNALKRHPLTFKRTAGFSATGSLSRKAFGIDAWSKLIGDEVRLIIEAEAVRARDDAPDKQPDGEPGDAAAQ